MVLVDLHGAAASADLARLRQHWWLNKHRINGYNRDRQTPLHLACINGHADVVQFLVEKKCKLNPCDKFNKSPLMKAVEHQHGDCAAILLEHGANHNHRGVRGNTALHIAVLVSNKSLVELLLEHGADINAKNKLGYTPLTLAITENCEEMVKFLLQKGADVNVQDNVFRSPLTVAILSGNKKAIQLLLHHGAAFSEIDKRLYPCQAFTKMGQNVVIANEQIGSSCCEKTPVTPLETPASAESCDVPKEKAAKKEDNGPAADQNKASVCTVKVQPYRGDYKEGAEKKEGKHSFYNPEADPKSQGKVRASVWLPAANSNRLDARSAAVEHGKGVLPAASVESEKKAGDSSWCSEPNSGVLDEVPATVLLPADVCRIFPKASVAKECIKGAWQAAGAAKEEDNGFFCNPKHLSDLIDKAINPVQHPAGKRSRRGVHSVAEKRGKGVLQPAGGAVKKEDTDSPWDSEAGPKSQRKVRASVWLPAANSNRLDARSAAVEHGKGVLPAASVESEKKAGDSSWCSEPFSEIVEEVFAGERCPAADCKGVGMYSSAVECSEVVLPPAGGAGQDDDSSWDSETDSKGEGKVWASVWLPAANRLDARSAVVEHGKGVLKQVWGEVKKQYGVLQPAGGEAKQEDSDFPWHSKTDSEGEGKVSADVQLPAADQNRVGVSSAAVERDKAARAGHKEHFISSSENKLPTLQGEDLQLKVDSSTQTDSEQDRQPLARQKLDKILKKNSLKGAPLGAVKTNSRKEQKLLLEKLERCKTRLKDLKELLNKNGYYAESGKNALKEKKVITILRNIQGRLIDSFDSSAAAIPQLEERIQRIQIQIARLEATIQQQARTIEVFEQTRKSLTSDSSVDTRL